MAGVILFIIGISLIIAIIPVGILISHGVDSWECEEKGGAIAYYLGAFLCLAVCTTGVFFMTCSPNADKKNWIWEEETAKVADIYSIKQGSSVNSSFFLGTGSIKEADYYYYYIKTDKGFLLDKVIAKGTYIVEDDNVVPNVSYVREAWNLSISKTYTITVPTNTVKVRFDL
jgi:hypothetical protein